MEGGVGEGLYKKRRRILVKRPRVFLSQTNDVDRQMNVFYDVCMGRLETQLDTLRTEKCDTGGARVGTVGLGGVPHATHSVEPGKVRNDFFVSDVTLGEQAEHPDAERRVGRLVQGVGVRRREQGWGRTLGGGWTRIGV